jgi:glycerol-3-phosphate cytidylyltransferase
MIRVITFGTFDMFHIGHLKILQRASKLGDYLAVGVSSDELNLRKKGFRPLFPLADRLEIIRNIVCVDEVFIEDSLEAKGDYIQTLKANILVMGDDWVGQFDHLRVMCKVVYLERTPDISSTRIKERLRLPL